MGTDRHYIGLSRLQLAEGVRLPLVFFHIPRTGGITFHEILTRVSAPVGHARHLPGDSAVYELIAAEPDFFRRHGIYSGHFSSDILPLIPQGASKLTFVRHPAALLRSTYHLLRNLTLHGHDTNLDHDGRFASKFCIANTFEAFLESSDPRLLPYTRNPQTRILSLGNSFDPARVRNPALLAAAKEALSGFQFVGITERYPEALRLFQWHYLRTPIRRFYLRNASPGSLVQGVPARVQELVAEICALDLELYTHACALFNRRIAASEGFHGAMAAKASPLPRSKV